MPDFYSQQGEDGVVSSLFQGVNNGTYIDVGAHDGIRFSNTYHFDLRGWRGLCCEPHPGFFKLLKDNRPNATCIDKAISDYKGKASFYANSRGALSTLDKSFEKSFSGYGQWFTGFEEVEVDVDTLDNTLEEMFPYQIDIASIDVEGTEIAVLRGFNLEKWKPKVLIIETNEQDKIDKHMADHGYTMVRRIIPNTIYIAPDLLPKLSIIQLAKGPGKLVHTDGRNIYLK
jgi:FkbM family methyltransferase